MSWDRKGSRGPYYYQSIRIGGKVCKRYLGRGKQAEKAAEEIEQRRQVRQKERETHQQELVRITHAQGLLSNFKSMIDALFMATMQRAGIHCHHGEWRRRGKGTEGQQ